jgi:hypothetical protein
MDYEHEGTGYEDGAGEIVREANILGAMARRGQQRPQHPNQGRQVYERPPLPQVPAHPHTSRLKSYLGLGFATWGSADATDKPLQVQPQESFRGGRLIVDLSLVNGPSAGMVLMRRIDIGTMPQSPSVEQPAPAAMFAANATYAAIDLQIAYRATTIQVTLGITAAPGGTCAVTAACGFFGEWIR